MVDFKIEITKDRVSVSDAVGGWPPDVGTTIVFFVLSALTVCIVATWLTTGDVWLSPSNWPLLFGIILFAGMLLWGALRSLFPSGQSLTCDRSTLTIGRIPRSSLRGLWRHESFPISAVKDLQFASVAFSGRTPVLGLRFKVEGKTKKTLAGLESPEAAKILDALAGLGVNSVRDPAMPMMVDMTLSRRKHFGGLL
jgi:hypothetical protein